MFLAHIICNTVIKSNQYVVFVVKGKLEKICIETYVAGGKQESKILQGKNTSQSSLTSLLPMRKTVSPDMKYYDNFSHVFEPANEILHVIHFF